MSKNSLTRAGSALAPRGTASFIGTFFMWYRKEDAEGDLIERDNDVFELARDTVGVAGLGKPSALPALAVRLRMQGGGRGIRIVRSVIAVIDGLGSFSEIEFSSCGVKRPDSLLEEAVESVA